PHISKALSGTQLKYNFRGQSLTVVLDLQHYSVSNGQYKIICSGDFGFYGLHNQLSFFRGHDSAEAMGVKTGSTLRLTLDIKYWEPKQMEWLQVSENKRTQKLAYTLSQLRPDSKYMVTVAGKMLGHFKSDHTGAISFNYKTSGLAEKIIVTRI
ncbi:MAG: fibronectin type III domain-containing protein, partial [Puia sp.]